MKPVVEAFFDKATCTVSYIVREPEGKACAIIDPVLDFDAKSGRTARRSAMRLIEAVEDAGLDVVWTLETHAHADHLSGAAVIKEALGGQSGIGAGIVEVQETFKGVFNLGPEFTADGSQFDRLFTDGEVFEVGAMAVEAMHTPGHTPACMAFRIGDAVFVGDTIFMPDFGTARTDFPGGDAAALYRSIRRLLSLAPETRLFMCHDYAPGGRDFAWETTVADERAANIHVHDGVSEADFVALRKARDATLEMPRLILPAIQVNIRAGHMPPPEDNGITYLKLPVDAL
jgi:glyoxylase-like metal-dependent hydrolase (beta-lactamase superfamily II)